MSTTEDTAALKRKVRLLEEEVRLRTEHEGPAAGGPLHDHCPSWALEHLGVLSDGEVAQRCQVSPGAARMWRVRRGIKPAGHKHRVTPDARAKRIAIIELTDDNEEAGKLLGLSRERVRQLRVRYGLTSSQAPGGRKVEGALCQQAYNLWAELGSVAKAAEVQGVHPSTAHSRACKWAFQLAPAQGQGSGPGGKRKLPVPPDRSRRK